MRLPSDSPRPANRLESVFLTTSWHDLRLFRGEGAESEEARERLCARYRRPVLVYIRCFLGRDAGSGHWAEDLVQEFFLQVLRRLDLPEERRGEGRFRAFLMVAVRRFLLDRMKADRRLKRRPEGGWVSIEDPEYVVGCEAGDGVGGSPEQAMTRSWALEILRRALDRVRREFQALKPAGMWEAIEPMLEGERQNVPYARLASRWSMTEGAFKVLVHRTRDRFRQSIRMEVARTLGWQGDGVRELEQDLMRDANLRRQHDEEMSHLLAAVN